jgi:protein-disulfide isomerase
VQVRGTPTIFINGKQIGLQSPAQLHAAIEDAIKSGGALAVAANTVR